LLVDLRSTAVDHDRMNADVFEQHDVAREALAQRALGHGRAAVLDDERFALEAPDVRQRLQQNGRFFDQLAHGPWPRTRRGKSESLAQPPGKSKAPEPVSTG
jgi:hypothetical protein